MSRGGLPAGAGSGYVYDWIRQRQKASEENRKQKKKQKRKVKKLTKKKRKERHGEPNKIERVVKGIERRFEEEKKHLHGTK